MAGSQLGMRLKVEQARREDNLASRAGSPNKTEAVVCESCSYDDTATVAGFRA